MDESAGFAPVRLLDPAKLRDDLVSAVSDQLVPPIRLDVELVEVDAALSRTLTNRVGQGVSRRSRGS